MSVNGVLARKTERSVIDCLSQCLAGVAGVIDVCLKQHVGLFEVQVGVVLMLGVVRIGGVQSTAHRTVIEQIGPERTDTPGLGIGTVAV